MAPRYTTSSTLRVNGSVGSFNLVRTPVAPDGSAVAEGDIFYIDANGFPVKVSTSDGGDPTAAARPVFVNWVASGRSDVGDAQAFAIGDTDAASIALDSGGLTGLVGNNVLLGLPKSSFAASQTFTPGWYVVPTATAGKLGTATSVPDVDGSAAGVVIPIAGGVSKTLTVTVTLTYKHVYGRIVRVEGEIVWFLFNSQPTTALVGITSSSAVA